MKVLVVDDEILIRNVIKEYLKINNIDFDEADNGEEAIRLVNQNKYDCIVMDIMMPKMDGFTAVKEIKKISDAKIIMLSARTEEYDKLSGFDLGIDDYVTKPFSPKELMARINAVIKRYKGEDDFYFVPVTHSVTLGQIADLIQSFRESRKNLMIPNMKDEFSKKLYSTYLSYLPEEEFSYPVKMNIDNRGSFTELFKSEERGQVSVNISKPGIVKGNHWHNTKNEKFIVVSGKAIIRFRKVDSDKVLEYNVCGDKLEVVDIPCGYTHNIENIGDTDLVTIMWANEVFNPDKPDTFYMEV